MENVQLDYLFFTFAGRNNDENKVFYNDLPEEIRCKLDVSITKRTVHLSSVFAKSALKGGYDPEKVSFNTLVSKGLIKDNYLKKSKF